MKSKRPDDIVHLENEELRQQLDEARSTIEAIKNGEVDALVISGKNGHELFTLRSADHTYRIFIEKMTEGAVTLNAEGQIVYCNSSFASMVGQSFSNVVANTFEHYVLEADREQFSALLAQAWHSDCKGEFSLIHPSGIIPVQLSFTPLGIEDGMTLSILVTDLSAQKEALKQVRIKNEQLAAMNVALELSNHDLQQFASVASHDLQEPLRKILIFSSSLKNKFYPELSQGSRHLLEKIESSANRMKTLIIDILNYSKLSSNTNEYAKTDLHDVIDELLEDLELTIQQKNATIKVHDLPVVEINRGQMRQVFQNLVSNALKFSKKDIAPHIEIFSTTEDITLEGLNTPKRWCHIHIKDNGIGFDPKYSRIIFNLFEKLHSKDDYEGTGIGLAITKKIIEKHHGHIDVTSEPGIGTEFILSLPAYQTKTD